MNILTNTYGSQVYSKCNYVFLDGNIYDKLNQIKDVKKYKNRYIGIFLGLSQSKLRVKFVTQYQKRLFDENNVENTDEKDVIRKESKENLE